MYMYINVEKKKCFADMRIRCVYDKDSPQVKRHLYVCT